MAKDIWDMEEVDKNLAEIEEWIDSAPEFTTFLNNKAYMEFTVKLMSYCLYLLRLGVALAPTKEVSEKGYSKQKAIIVGHMVRIVKLYEGLLIYISNRQIDLASIFIRLIYETAMRMEYIMKSKTRKKTIRSFILTSYRPEKEILDDLKGKASKRNLIQIERRIKRKIGARLKQDRISTSLLMSNKNWKLDGKDTRQILKEIGVDIGYSYIFGTSSHFIHGDWLEIYYHHLNRNGRYYKPNLSYGDPDPELACPLTFYCLNILLMYLQWNKSDPDDYVSPIITKLYDLTKRLDIAHENTLGE